MDTNKSRRADKEQRLSYRQFVRRINKLNFTRLTTRVFDVEYMLYYLLMMQGLTDVRGVLYSSDRQYIKYPLSMLLFGALRLYKKIIGHYPTAIVEDKFWVGVAAFQILPAVERDVADISRIFIGEVVQFSKNRSRILPPLDQLIIKIGLLIESLDLSVEHVLYLSHEFYKDVPFLDRECDPDGVLKRFETLRLAALTECKDSTGTDTSYFGKYLAMRYDELKRY